MGEGARRTTTGGGQGASFGRYDRSPLRYPSDLTDEEWALVGPMIPPAKDGGNKRRVKVREVVNGIMYILSTGCQWRAVPKDLPPRSTLFDYLDLWSLDGTLDRMHHALYVVCRKRGQRKASPTAAIIESQSVKSAEKTGLASIPMGMTRDDRSGRRSGPRWRHLACVDAVRVPSWKSSLRMAATKEPSSVVGWRILCLASKLKLSDVRLTAKVLWCSHAVGLSNAHRLAEPAVAGWPRNGTT